MTYQYPPPINPIATTVAVLPLKNGCWRVVRVAEDLRVVDGAVRLSPAMYAKWGEVYKKWYVEVGYRRAHSPEFWPLGPRDERE
jgi:hypothetical protein